MKTFKTLEDKEIYRIELSRTPDEMNIDDLTDDEWIEESQRQCIKVCTVDEFCADFNRGRNEVDSYIRYI